MNTNIKIEYWNDCNLEIYYGNGFKQNLYLNTDLVEPEYIMEEEGMDDGDREFNRIFGKIKKTFKCEFVAPEFLLQALTFMQIHNERYCYLKTGESGKMLNVQITKSPIMMGCYYRIEMSFAVDFIISECCRDLRCLESTHEEIDGRYDTDSNEWNLPEDVPVLNGRRYLFYEPGTAYNGSIYTYNAGLNLWVIESQVQWDVVAYGELNLVLDGIWRQYPTVIQDGAFLKGYAIPGTFVQAQEFVGAVWVDVEDPVTDGVFTGTGIEMSIAPGVDVRVYCYNHSCDYGESEAITIS